MKYIKKYEKTDSDKFEYFINLPFINYKIGNNSVGNSYIHIEKLSGGTNF